MAKTFQIDNIQAGDIIFMDSRPANFWDKVDHYLNVRGQRALAAARTRSRVPILEEMPQHSHVMLGMIGGLVIHADGKTVAMDIVSDALDHATPAAATYKVFRYRKMTPLLAERITEQATWYYGQKYRFLRFFGADRVDDTWQDDTSQFCSSLIAKAYGLAQIKLCDLPDNRVLPLDLYRACSTSDDWSDVTAIFEDEPITEKAGEYVLPGGVDDGPVTLAEFFERTDGLIRQSAELAVKGQAARHRAMRQGLMIEGLLAKYATARFELAKAVWGKPDVMTDDVAASVVRVLQQLDVLLKMSLLQNFEMLVQDSELNRGHDPDRGPFAGFPPPKMIRDMQINREKTSAFAYLLLAQIGLTVIVAHRYAPEKLARFRAVDRRYAAQFLAAVPQIDGVEPYASPDKLFNWIDQESDRDTWRKTLGNIIQGWRLSRPRRTQQPLAADA